MTAAIEADQPVFQEYMGGVLNSPSCGKKVDHIVTIVGFNDEAVEPYWIVITPLSTERFCSHWSPHTRSPFVDLALLLSHVSCPGPQHLGPAVGRERVREN